MIKNSFIYLIAEILNKAIPFLLLPIITKYLTPSEYGIYGIYQVLLSFLSPFIRMSLDVHITRNFFKVSKKKLKEILNSIILLLHLHVLIGLIVIFFLSLFFNDILGIPSKYLFLIPIIIYAQMINLFNLTILRNEEKALKYGMLQIIITLFNFGSVIIFLIYLKLGWLSLIYGLLVGQFVMFFYSFYFLKKEFNLDFKSFYPFKEIYRISVPLIFHLLGGSIIFLSDRVFIQQMLGLKEVGLYSIGNQFGMITMIVINSVILAINPWMYKKLAKKENIKKEIFLFMFLFLIIGLLVWIGSLIIFTYMVDSSYILAKSIIFWISLAFIFRGWYQLYYNVVLEAGKTNIFMYITFGAGIINLILNYFLIKLNGMVGAAQATMLAFSLMFIGSFLYIKRGINEK